jgi:peptide/nickel transport system permease protein
MEQRREVAIPERLPGVEPRPARALRQVARAARRNTTMSVGIIVVLLMALVAILAPLLTTVGPKDIDPINRLKAPAAQHWFGTDTLGRDVYARTIFGTRVSLLVGFSVAVAAMALGSLIGLLVGYYRKLDAVAMRVMDGLMAVPTILLAIALVATLGASMQNVIASLVIVETPRMARLIRASTMSLREQSFVDAARAMGAGPGRILGNHIFPNTIAPLIVQGTFVCASAVLVEAALSFLGAGTPPEVPSWGNMMAEGRSYIEVAVWMITFPGLALTLTVLGINLAGDGLRDALDPKLRRRG